MQTASDLYEWMNKTKSNWSSVDYVAVFTPNSLSYLHVFSSLKAVCLIVDLHSGD